jgi:zinc protease
MEQMSIPSPLVTTLTNGLTVVMEPRHHVPVTSLWVTYRVGSRDEPDGMSGASHWLEHLLFKPTERFPNAERDRLIARSGGNTNAFTWIDGTAYFSTVPATEARLICEIEADRMANSLLDPDQIEVERSVILAERKESENEPDWRLAEEVVREALSPHPYSHEILGSEEDIRGITREQLVGHYRAHYHPSNAVLTAVGDFQPDEMLRTIEETLGAISGGPATDRRRFRTAPDRNHKSIVQRGPGASGYLYAAYPSPASTDDDFVASMVLCAVLSGPIGLALSSAQSRTSRLYHSLIESGMAVDVDCNTQAALEPHLIELSVVLRDSGSHEEAQTLLDEELARIAAHSPATDELARAQKETIARHVFSNERVTDRAMMLMFGSLVFGTGLIDELPDRVRAVTAEDVRRTAERYLRIENRVTGWFIPEAEES